MASGLCNLARAARRSARAAAQGCRGGRDRPADRASFGDDSPGWAIEELASLAVPHFVGASGALALARAYQLVVAFEAAGRGFWP
jgi:hypothetical protein